MALLEPIHAAYVGVTATILIGIFAEGARAQVENVLGNLTSFFLILATTNMNWQVLLGLSLYLGLGFFVVYEKMRDLYLLFGSKSYGSIALVILFAESRLFGITFDDLRTVLTACIVVVVSVHVLGFMYSSRNKKGRKGKRKK